MKFMVGNEKVDEKDFYLDPCNTDIVQIIPAKDDYDLVFWENGEVITKPVESWALCNTYYVDDDGDVFRCRDILPLYVNHEILSLSTPPVGHLGVVKHGDTDAIKKLELEEEHRRHLEGLR